MSQDSVATSQHDSVGIEPDEGEHWSQRAKAERIFLTAARLFAAVSVAIQGQGRPIDLDEAELWERRRDRFLDAYRALVSLTR